MGCLCPNEAWARERASARQRAPARQEQPSVSILTAEIQMKILGRIVVVLVSLLVVAGVIVYFTVDGILKRTIEKNGTTSLKLTTTLNSAHLSLLGGKVKLNKLGIASPAGFSAPRMLEMHDINLAVSYGALRKDPIHVQSLV